jgi:hypothetical protein
MVKDRGRKPSGMDMENLRIAFATAVAAHIERHNGIAPE